MLLLVIYVTADPILPSTPICNPLFFQCMPEGGGLHPPSGSDAFAPFESLPLAMAIITILSFFLLSLVPEQKPSKSSWPVPVPYISFPGRFGGPS